ncbi:hypothetical protein COTS27_00827 [Spirochaetota bacterium]|nr:hypothetical protein COTS27_00827 [Spirochaetota bacterium]
MNNKNSFPRKKTYTKHGKKTYKPGKKIASARKNTPARNSYKPSEERSNQQRRSQGRFNHHVKRSDLAFKKNQNPKHRREYSPRREYSSNRQSGDYEMIRKWRRFLFETKPRVYKKYYLEEDIDTEEIPSHTLGEVMVENLAKQDTDDRLNSASLDTDAPSEPNNPELYEQLSSERELLDLSELKGRTMARICAVQGFYALHCLLATQIKNPTPPIKSNESSISPIPTSPIRSNDSNLEPTDQNDKATYLAGVLPEQLAFVKRFWLDHNDLTLTEKELQYAEQLICGTFQRLQEINDFIKKSLRGWELDRLPLMRKSVLQIFLYSLASDKTTPRKVIINDGVRIAKWFLDENDYKFVNAVLDKYRS